MKYLLDTHTFICFIMAPKKLSKKVLNIIKDGDNDIYISPITFWEIAIKHRLGKINLGKINPIHFPNIATGYEFSILPLNAYDYATISGFPVKGDHQDPFEQMLIHTAINKNFILLSEDKKFKQYEKDGLQLIW